MIMAKDGLLKDDIQYLKECLMNIFSSFLRKGSYKEEIVKDSNLENLRMKQFDNQPESVVLLMAEINGCKKQNDLLCNMSKNQALGKELAKKERVGN